MNKNLASILGLLITLHLSAQDIGSHVRVTCEKSCIDLGYAEVVATNATQITVKDEFDTFTFERSNVTISPAAKPGPKFTAYTAEPKPVDSARVSLPQTQYDQPVTNRPPLQERLESLNYLRPGAMTNENTFRNIQQYYKNQAKANNLVKGQSVVENYTYASALTNNHPNLYEQTFHVGDVVRVRFSDGFTIPDTRIVDYAKDHMTFGAPPEYPNGRRTITIDAKEMAAINITKVK